MARDFFRAEIFASSRNRTGGMIWDCSGLFNSKFCLTERGEAQENAHRFRIRQRQSIRGSLPCAWGGFRYSLFLILAMVFFRIGISPHKSLAKPGARQIAHQARTRQPV